MTENYKIPNRKDLRKVPTDEIIEATIVNIEFKTWRELISEDKLHKFDNPDAVQLIIKYDAAGFIRDEKYTYLEKPTTTSKLGRFIVKYDSPEVGDKIKVQFDEDGKSNIVIAK